MSEHFVDLGGVAVLDAHNLEEGHYVEIDGHLLIVERIVDDSKVYLQPVTGWQLRRYRIKEFFKQYKALVVVTGVLLIGALVYLFFVK